MSAQWLLRSIAVACLVALVAACQADAPQGPAPRATLTGLDEPEARWSPTAEATDAAPFDPPPFSPAFAGRAEDYYQLGFLPDGTPGRVLNSGEVEPHPIYAVYVIADWLTQYAEEPTTELRDALSTVAAAAVARMETVDDALVVMYGAGTVDRSPVPHYSALTQGYYASHLWQVAEITEDVQLRTAARRSFEALLIPASRGGVLVEVDGIGPALEEVPQQPPALILNGWQSALVSVWEYYELSGDPRARELVQDSARAMEELLPLYDVPDLRNSRYGLTGFVYLRAVGHGPSVGEGSVLVEGQTPVPFTNSAESRWQPHLIEDDVRADKTWSNLRMNAVTSLAAPTTVTLDLAGEVERVEAFVGKYDPLATSPVDGEWHEISTWSHDDNRLTIDIPTEVASAVAYPTNFLKELEGQQTNVYHRIHILRLRSLADITGRATFDEWADVWDEYVCEWHDMPIYDGLSVSTPRQTEQVTRVDQACPPS